MEMIGQGRMLTKSKFAHCAIIDPYIQMGVAKYGSPIKYALEEVLIPKLVPLGLIGLKVKPDAFTFTFDPNITGGSSYVVLETSPNVKQWMQEFRKFLNSPAGTLKEITQEVLLLDFHKCKVYFQRCLGVPNDAAGTFEFDEEDYCFKQVSEELIKPIGDQKVMTRNDKGGYE